MSRPVPAAPDVGAEPEFSVERQPPDCEHRRVPVPGPAAATCNPFLIKHPVIGGGMILIVGGHKKIQIYL